MKLSHVFVAALGLAVLACGPAGTTSKREASPLPPLKKTEGKDPNVTAHGGTVYKPDGSTFDMNEVHASANAILVFYRGAW